MDNCEELQIPIYGRTANENCFMQPTLQSPKELVQIAGVEDEGLNNVELAQYRTFHEFTRTSGN